MDEPVVYNFAVATAGCAFVWLGISALVTDGAGLVPVLIAIGGAGMVVGTVYELALSAGPPAAPADERVLWLTAVGAVVAAIGAGASAF